MCGTPAAAISKDFGRGLQYAEDACLSDSVSRHFSGICVIDLQVIDLYHLTVGTGVCMVCSSATTLYYNPVEVSSLMKIDILLTADSVQVANEKLYILGGGWRYVYVLKFPTEHNMGIALGILVPWEQTNIRHDIEVVLLDEDGNQILESPLVKGQFETGRPPGISPGSEQRVLMAVNFRAPLRNAGQYQIVARLDGHDESMATFQALPVSPPAA